MAIFNLGSVNADMFYQLPHLVQPGETLAATGVYTGLGGKGTNMSVAAARAGAQVHHIGAVGPDGAWAVDRLRGFGVDTRFLTQVEERTGHAIIMVDARGENAIVLFPGANQAIPEALIAKALGAANPGDLVLMQNETCHQGLFAQAARARGLRVAYAAAPFDPQAVQEVLPSLDFLFLNRVEAAQLADHLGTAAEALPVPHVLITLGAQGCRYIDTNTGVSTLFSAPKVTPVDTTGAGDTFTGYVLAGLDRGLDMPAAIDRAQKAAALMVTRKGTADVIPTAAEVDAF